MLSPNYFFFVIQLAQLLLRPGFQFTNSKACDDEEMVESFVGKALC